MREFLSSCHARFCLIYRGQESKAGLDLKWCKAASSDKKTHEEYDKLAAKYREVAVHCYQHNRNLILKESAPRANSQSQRWCGINIPTGTNEDLPSSSPLDWLWWHLVVGAGATHDAGYAIVTRVAAKEAKELHDHIAKMQAIMT